MDGRGFASETSPTQFSPARSPICRPFTTVGVGKSSVPRSPTYSKQAWPTLKKRTVAESNLAPYGAYATSAVDVWKKLARKAELELHLEVDSHRADNAKNSATIHRINRRLIPLEKALGKAKEALKHQEKLITYFKCQLMAAEERKNMEISYLQSQNGTFQKRLAGTTHTNEQKILELQEELHQADSRAGTLQAQINEIYKNVDDETDRVDGSGTRAGSPASPKDGMGSGKKVQGQNKQNLGLVAVAKIHKMRLSKQYIKEKLTESEEELILVVQENDRLRKLAQDAVARSNKFLDLAQTLKVDRDLTMSRLKETEDIIKSLEALKDLVNSYLKTTSPRLGTFLPGPHFHKPVHKTQEELPSNKNTKDLLEIETADLPTTRAGCHKKAVCFQGDVGTGAQSIGESLVKKLEAVFQMLAYKVETANQTVKTVKKEEEKIRLTMLEAFQELRGQKGSKLNTADDVALGVLIAVRDVKQTLEGLEKEKALLKASESMEDEKVMRLQSQVHELSMDRLALLDSLESVKSAIKAANAGHGIIQYVTSFYSRRIIQGENISEVLEMVGKLISERNEARSMGGGLMEEKLLKEKELSDLRKLYGQSQTLIAHLQVEKDLLKKERNELKANCEDLKQQNVFCNAEKKRENNKKILELKSEIHDLVLDRAALLETLEAIKKALGTSQTGDEALEYLKGFLKRSVVQGINVFEVVELVEKFVAEKEEAKLKGSRLMEEREIKESELQEIKRHFAQSQSLCVNLEGEKNLLYTKLSELQKSAHALKTEKEFINASSIEKEKKILELQTGLHDLTQERAASRETLNILKNTFRAANSIAARQPPEDNPLKSLKDENGSELLAMAEQLVKERNEARFGGRTYEEEVERKEKELSDLRHLYAESKSLSESLQNEKGELEMETKRLRNTVKTIKGSIFGEPDLEPETSDRRSPLELGGLSLENMVKEVLVIKEKLHAANCQLARDKALFEKIFQETKSIVSKEGHPPSDWESGISILISSLTALQAEKEQLSDVVTVFAELHSVLNKELKRLYEIMIPTEMNPTRLMEDRSELTAQEDIKADSGFRMVVRNLPSVVEEVGKLKMGKIKLEQYLQSLELEKEDAVRRSSEHLDKMRRLSDCSQQEVNELREQLNTVQSFISSVLAEGTTFPSFSPEDISSKQNIKHNSLFKELELIRKELLALRTEKANLEVTVDELRSKGGSEQDKSRDLAMKLSSAEAQVQTLSSRALAADSRIQSLESQYAAGKAQLSELFGAIQFKDLVKGSGGESSSAELQTACMDIETLIKIVQNKVSDLFLAREEEVSKRAREASKWRLQQEGLERDSKLSTAEVERLREKLNGQGEFIKKHTAEWTKLVENLKSEIARLGGSDLKDEGEKLRKSLAAEKLKELLAPALSRNSSSSGPQTSTDPSPSCNPLLSLATFQVDLLVNNKVHSQLKVSGHNGGLCQAALHYFYVDGKTGEITFENATIPGSQSSNLVVDLFMQPVDSKKGYQTQAGDVLGLRVKLSAFNDSSLREVLHSTSIIRTDEVLEAIQGQMIQNFSLWPDIESSWRWERDVKKNKWSLMSVRWRFLLKNIFPDLSAPLQDLTIRGAAAPRSSSIHIM